MNTLLRQIRMTAAARPILGRARSRAAALALTAALAAPAGLHAQQPPRPDTTEVIELPELTVVGRNQAVATSSVLARALQAQAATGSNALGALNRAPSFNFTSADPNGFYEYGQNIQLRAFNFQQISMTLDGIPLGAQNGGGGTPVGRMVENESVERVTVQQGSGNIENVSNFGLGGAVVFRTTDPKAERSGEVKVTAGEFNTLRTYVRYDTGDLGSGTRGYASFSRNAFEKWRGAGGNTRHHIEAKIRQDFDRGHLSLNFYGNKRDDHDYLDLSLADIETLGPDFELSTQYVVRPDKEAQAQANAVFFDGWTNNRWDMIVASNLELRVTDRSTVKLTPYFHNQSGMGSYLPPYRPDDTSDDPFGDRDWARSTWRETQYSLNRVGVAGSFAFDLGPAPAVTVGGWAEHNERMARRVWFDMPDMDVFEGPDAMIPYWTEFDRNYVTDTYTGYVKGEVRLLPDLRLNVGLRSHYYEVDYQDDVVNAVRTIDDVIGFLPQLGLVYDLGPEHQLFGSVSRNFSQVPDGALSQEAPVDPEKALNVDFGYRFLRPGLSTSVNLFFVNYTDKIEAITFGPFDRYASQAAYANVGEIRSLGVELTGDYRLPSGFGLFSSVSFNNSTYEKDFADASEEGGILRIEGNRAVFTPAFQTFAELSWRQAGFDVNLNGRFVGPRKASLSGPVDGDPADQEEIESHFLLGASASYAWRRFSLFLNGSNLADTEYVASSSANGPGTARHPDTQTYYPGAPRWITFGVGVGF